MYTSFFILVEDITITGTLAKKLPTYYYFFVQLGPVVSSAIHYIFSFLIISKENHNKDLIK